MIADFRTFIDNLIVEELHPDIKKIIEAPGNKYGVSKQTKIAKEIKKVTSRGEQTGIEGNMPAGSSRAYLKNDSKYPIVLDGKEEKIPTGTKVAIRAKLDAHHKPDEHDGLGLGAMQNRAEGGDHYTNSQYRILTQKVDPHTHREIPGHYESNKEQGIFPPLIHHDHDNHEWSHVGHVRDIKAGEFRKLTKTASHPKGISHEEFSQALNRQHDKNNGKYWGGTLEHEKNMDRVTAHPLVQKFLDYHNNYGHPPYDYAQKKNLGVFEHPDGSHHIVARDHGFDSDVSKAYADSKKRMMKR
jgi:hypothetical protein